MTKASPHPDMAGHLRLSLVVPVYNEEEVLPKFLDRIEAVAGDIKTKFITAKAMR